MSTLSRGALVRLNAALPVLRVTGLHEGAAGLPTVAVAWYTPDGQFRRADLPADILEPVAPPGEDPPAELGIGKQTLTPEA